MQNIEALKKDDMVYHKIQKIEGKIVDLSEGLTSKGMIAVEIDKSRYLWKLEATELINTPLDYFDHPAMSQSKLKELKKSPRHFWSKYIDPNRGPEKETKAMKFGTAVHMCLFEHEKFTQKYIIDLNTNKKTEAGKLEYEAFLIENSSKIIITKEEMRDIKRIRDSILNKNSYKFFNGLSHESELEIYWTDLITGIECKAKIDDYIFPCESFKNGIAIDLKTTTDASAESFQYSIKDYGYDHQMAWYCEGLKTKFNLSGYPIFVFIPVEKTLPFDCAFYQGDKTMLEMGLYKNRKLLNLYKHCLDSNNWYGYDDNVQYISMPKRDVYQYNLEILEGNFNGE